MTTENTFRFTILLLFLTAFTISVYFRRKADLSGGENIQFEEEGTWIYRFRVLFALLGYGSVLVYLAYPPLMQWSQVSLPLWLRWTGIGIMLTMLPLLYWMFSSLGKNITPTVVTRKDHSLVTEGPYKWIRHPLYTFGTANFIGLSLAAANWFILLMMVSAFVTLHARTYIEEAKLLEKFGDEYQKYINTTGRYFPRLGKGNI